ncbi:MAG: hypothetical protein CMA63_03590 [Euryarchaeota archaeon]|nr:hypothetical protein [Euryarchaeota archaeon]|tara:strand:- start:25 stop:423 length:399 start_codon:yes stop_codon:yes gene_type:complete
MGTAEERKNMQYFGAAILFMGIVWMFNLGNLCTNWDCFSYFWGAAFVIVMGCITLFIAIFEDDDEFLMHKFWLGFVLPALTTIGYTLIAPTVFPGLLVAAAVIYYGVRHEPTPELTLGGFLGILFTLLYLQF